MKGYIGNYVFIRREDRRILLVQDARKPYKWSLPGAGLNPKQLVTNAAFEGAKKQAGITTEIDNSPLGIFSHSEASGVMMVWEGTIREGNPIPDNEETKACRWVSWGEMWRMRKQIKPAQLSAVYQIIEALNEETSTFPIINIFDPPLEQ